MSIEDLVCSRKNWDIEDILKKEKKKCLFFLFLVTPQHMWDLSFWLSSSLPFSSPLHWNHRVITTGWTGMSPRNSVLNILLSTDGDWLTSQFNIIIMLINIYNIHITITSLHSKSYNKVWKKMQWSQKRRNDIGSRESQKLSMSWILKNEGVFINMQGCSG